MKKGYEKSNEAAYREIFELVTGNYKMEDASFEDFMNKAITRLPRKMRKQLTAFWGINGGVNHAEKIRKLKSAGKRIPDSDMAMHALAFRAIRSLRTIEYMYFFHKDVRDIVKKVAKKTSGESEIRAAAEWAELYAVMIINGPYLPYDEEPKEVEKGLLAKERVYAINHAMILEATYDNFFSKLPNGELLIPVVKAWLEDLDVENQATVLKFFGIHFPKYLEEFEGEEIETFMHLRQLKERIFFNGRWASDGFLFLRSGIPENNKETIEGFCKIYELWRKGAKIERAQPEIYQFGTGKKEISLYCVQGEEEPIAFPYIEEIMIVLPAWDKYANEA